MAELKITDIVGANVKESTEKAEYEVGAKGRTTDGVLVQYVQAGESDIAKDADIAFDSNGKAKTKGESDTKVGTAYYALKAGEYGFIAIG